MRRWSLRSKSRDLISDESRLNQVETAVMSALESADREFDGLKRRVEDLRARCGFIMGNGDYEEREPADAKLLNEAEDMLRRAEERLDSLTTHMALLRHIHDILRRTVASERS